MYPRKTIDVSRLRLALSKLVEPGGFVDRDMFFNHVHVLSLIARE